MWKHLTTAAASFNYVPFHYITPPPPPSFDALLPMGGFKNFNLFPIIALVLVLYHNYLFIDSHLFFTLSFRPLRSRYEHGKFI